MNISIILMYKWDCPGYQRGCKGEEGHEKGSKEAMEGGGACSMYNADFINMTFWHLLPCITNTLLKMLFKKKIDKSQFDSSEAKPK